ncbi:unnamed protein product, partial [Discosporangium mesarthrocarpum]
MFHCLCRSMVSAHIPGRLMALSQVSGIIHKRVSFVVCTESALRQNTQKVRKAVKHGTPLVSQGFIEACLAAGTVVDPSPYLLTRGVKVKVVGLQGEQRGALKQGEGAPEGQGLGDEGGSASKHSRRAHEGLDSWRGPGPGSGLEGIQDRGSRESRG